MNKLHRRIRKRQVGTMLRGLAFTPKVTRSTLCLVGGYMDGHREIPSILESQGVE